MDRRLETTAEIVRDMVRMDDVERPIQAMRAWRLSKPAVRRPTPGMVSNR